MLYNSSLSVSHTLFLGHFKLVRLGKMRISYNLETRVSGISRYNTLSPPSSFVSRPGLERLTPLGGSALRGGELGDGSFVLASVLVPWV